MRNNGQEKKHKFYNQIIKDLQPIVKKYGRENVRLALTRFARIEREKKTLIQKIAEAKRELKKF